MADQKEEEEEEEEERKKKKWQKKKKNCKKKMFGWIQFTGSEMDDYERSNQKIFPKQILNSFTWCCQVDVKKQIFEFACNLWNCWKLIGWEKIYFLNSEIVVGFGYGFLVKI